MYKLLALLFFVFIGLSLADRRFRCRRSSGNRLGTAACLYKTEPDLTEIDGNRNVYCNETDVQGGVVRAFDFPDKNTPLCVTIVYYLAIELSVLHIRIWALIRGPWGASNSHMDEQKMQSCLEICKYFRDGGTVSISVVRAKPNYMGCYRRENGNSENIDRVNMPNEIDCGIFGEAQDTPAPPSGISAGWILVIIICVVVVVGIVVGGLFYYFKMREGGGLPFSFGRGGGKTEQPVSFVPSVSLEPTKEGGPV